MADEPRSTDLPITATDVEHRFWTDQLEPSGQPRTSELLEEVPSFSYKDRVVSVSRKDLDALDNFLGLYIEDKGPSSVPPRIRASWTVAGKKWHQDLWNRSENVAPNYPLVPPEEEEHKPGLPRLTGVGQMFRGLGSMIGGKKMRAVRKLIAMAQQGYELLPEEQKLLGDVLDMEALTKQIPGTGKGLEYFRQMLGMRPEKPEEGILSLPMDDARADISTGTEITVDAYKGMPSQVGGPITNWLGEVIGNDPVKFLEEINNPNTPYAGFFSDDPAVASHFAEAITRSHNTVYPVKIDFKNPLVIDGKGKHAAAVQFRQLAWEEGMEEEFAKWQEAFAEGSPYDGVILKNALEPGSDQPTTSYIPKDSSQIRFRFAEFDPAQSESPHISKAAGGFVDKPFYDRAV